MAYEYGAVISRSVSEVLELPVVEILGFFAHKRVKADYENG